MAAVAGGVEVAGGWKASVGERPTKRVGQAVRVESAAAEAVRVETGMSGAWWSLAGRNRWRCAAAGPAPDADADAGGLL